MHRQQEACLFLDCQLCFCTHLRYLFYGFRFTTQHNLKQASWLPKSSCPLKTKRHGNKKFKRPQTRQMISEASILDFFCQLVRISKFPQSCPWDKWPHLDPTILSGDANLLRECLGVILSHGVYLQLFWKSWRFWISVCCRVADVTSWEGIQKLYCRTIYYIYICPTSNF